MSWWCAPKVGKCWQSSEFPSFPHSIFVNQLSGVVSKSEPHWIPWFYHGLSSPQFPIKLPSDDPRRYGWICWRAGRPVQGPSQQVECGWWHWWVFGKVVYDIPTKSHQILKTSNTTKDNKDKNSNKNRNIAINRFWICQLLIWCHNSYCGVGRLTAMLGHSTSPSICPRERIRLLKAVAISY